MTLEIFLIVVLWVIVGFWISYKRKWYKNFSANEDFPPFIVIMIVIGFAPLCLLIAFVREMLLDDWNNT